MSIKTEIERIEANVAAAYTALSGKGGTLPSAQTSANLAGAINSIPSGVDISASVTIRTTGWGSDSTAVYPKYYDIAVSGVTEKDWACVDISPAALSTAAACGLCPACETLAGKIRLRAVSVPAESMAANYWIEKGV